MESGIILFPFWLTNEGGGGTMIVRHFRPRSLIYRTDIPSTLFGRASVRSIKSISYVGESIQRSDLTCSYKSCLVYFYTCPLIFLQGFKTKLTICILYGAFYFTELLKDRCKKTREICSRVKFWLLCLPYFRHALNCFAKRRAIPNWRIGTVWPICGY
jgi:hypothetical protein